MIQCSTRRKLKMVSSPGIFIYFSFPYFQDGGLCADIGCGMCNGEAPCLTQQMGEPTNDVFNRPHQASNSAIPKSDMFLLGKFLFGCQFIHAWRHLGTIDHWCRRVYHRFRYHRCQRGLSSILNGRDELGATQGGQSRGERPLSAYPPCLPTFSTFGAVRMANKVVLDLLSDAGATGEPIHRSR